MYKKILSVLSCILLWASHSCVLGISPEKMGFKAYRIEDKQLGTVQFYISNKHLNKQKPLLIYLDGSGSLPLFQLTKNGIASSIAINFTTLSEKYHILILSKPGVPFSDSVYKDDEGHTLYEDSPIYTKYLSLDWRVNATQLAINTIQKDCQIDTNRIIVFGISEGVQVASKLASINKKITHLILFVGNGLNQFFDFIIQNRLNAQRGVISFKESQRNIDSLHMIYRDIVANPLSTDKFWYGHTYLRWSSFCKSNPTEQLKNLNIPIYIVAASNDDNTSVLGMDYLHLSSLAAQKSNITYKVYPYNHSLMEFTYEETGKIKDVKYHMNSIVDMSFEWLEGK